MQTDTLPNAQTTVKPAPMGAEGEHHTVRTDDAVMIAYTILGSGSRSLVFLHGWGEGGSGHSWTEVLKYLDLSGVRAILVDLRGHGASQQATTGFTVERFARDVLTVADNAGAGQFVTVAYSMSGKWAQWMACSAPDRVAGQVLLSPVPAADIPIPDSEKERWLAVARSGDMALFEEWVRPWSKESLPPEILDRYYYDVTHTSQVTLGATLDMCVRGGAFLDRLHTTRAPTLVVGGGDDVLLPPDALRQTTVSRIPGARLVVLDCGHEIPVEQPRVAAALLEAFVAGLGS